MHGSISTFLALLEDERFFFAAPCQAEALARLHFAAEHKLEFALVSGPAGGGKTALLRRFQLELRTLPTHTFFVNTNGMNAEELTLRFALNLGISAQEISGGLWLQVMRKLSELSYNHTPLVFLCDDLHLASGVVPLWLTRIWGLVPAHRLPITLVCAVDDSHGTAGLPTALRERIDLRIELEAWSLDDLFRFTQELHAAAEFSAPLFHEEALARLRQLAGGNPWAVRKLLRMAAIAGLGQERTEIDESTLLSVSEELCGITSAALETPVALAR